MGHAGYGMWSWLVVWFEEHGEVRSQTLARFGAGKRMEKFEDCQDYQTHGTFEQRGMTAREEAGKTTPPSFLEQLLPRVRNVLGSLRCSHSWTQSQIPRPSLPSSLPSSSGSPPFPTPQRP